MNQFAYVRHLKTLHAIFFSLFALITIWFYRMPLRNALDFFSDPQAIVANLRGLGALGPASLFLLMVAQVFLALIPGHALVMASGYVYGAPVTIAVVAASTILGSQLAFLLARRSGRALVYGLASPSAIERWDRVAGNRGGLFFFFTFVMPVFPADLMCYVAGLGKVSPKSFFAANVAGRCLAATAMTLIGAFGFRPPLWFWLTVLGFFAVLSAAWGIYNRSFGRIPPRSDIAFLAQQALSNAYRSVLRIRYDVQGMEGLPRGPKILVANHPGASDAILLPPLFGRGLVALAAAGQFRNPVVGWILRHEGHIPVYADRPREAFERACDALRAGKTVLIFPEGTLSSEFKSGKARSGAVRLSLASGAPLIPIGIHAPAADSINLRWTVGSRGHGGRYQFRGRYGVRIGRAWQPGAPDEIPLPVHELTRILMSKVYALVEQAALEDRAPHTSQIQFDQKAGQHEPGL